MKKPIQHFLKGKDECFTFFVFQQNTPTIFAVNLNNTWQQSDLRAVSTY